MARSLDARLARLEQAVEARDTRRLYARIASEFHMDPDELQRESEAFLSQPLPVKLREIDQLYAESLAENVPWDDYAWVQQTIIEWHRS
jgi:hypothetical protein